MHEILSCSRYRGFQWKADPGTLGCRQNDSGRSTPFRKRNGIAHSMAHTLGAVYDTPHGVACVMMLPIVMEYNQECTGEKYREIARAMGVQGADEMSQEEYRKAAIDAVKKLSADVGIPTKLDAIKEEYERAPIRLGSELFLCFVYCKNRGKMLKKFYRIINQITN